MESQKDTSFQRDTSSSETRVSEHLGMTPTPGKRVKNPKKSAIFDHITLKGHDASLEALRFS